LYTLSFNWSDLA